MDIRLFQKDLCWDALECTVKQMKILVNLPKNQKQRNMKIANLCLRVSEDWSQNSHVVMGNIGGGGEMTVLDHYILPQQPLTLKIKFMNTIKI